MIITSHLNASSKDLSPTKLNTSLGQFQIPIREYTQQYSHIYFCRLKQIKPALLQKATSKWGSTSVHHCDRVLDCQKGRESFLLGTIYVEQPERKGILDEVALEYHLEKQSISPASSASSSYYSGQSLYFLEDEHARIQLSLPPDCHFITGSVVAVAGVEGENGVFEVKEWTFAGLPPQEAVALAGNSNDSALLLVSGLRYNLSEGSSAAAALQFEMLKDLCVGNFGNPIPTAIEGLLLCGNSLLEPPRLVDEVQKKKFGAINYKYDTDHFKCFSRTLAQVLQAGKEVIVVPGATDPTNISLPQQPIHQALFKEAAAAASQSGKKLYLETNPSLLTINGLLCLLMDGQTVLDAQKHTPGHSVQQVMEYLLQSRHIAPTAPDTLCCYPCYERDPFVLSACPNVVICGGMSVEVKERVFWIEGTEGQRVCVILVPDFSMGEQALCVNFPSLQVLPIRLAFDSSLFKGRGAAAVSN